MDNQDHGLSHRLSGTDAAFLYLERKEIPLHIACVCVFDAEIPFDEFVANIDSKLHLIPRYRQIAVSPQFNLGYPTWEADPNFDIGRHIFQVRVDPPGGEAELEALAGRILSQVMDRAKPLWEIYIVEGLEDGRGALDRESAPRAGRRRLGRRAVEGDAGSDTGRLPRARASRRCTSRRAGRVRPRRMAPCWMPWRARFTARSRT